MKHHIRFYSSTSVNSAVDVSCDSAGTVAVPGLLALVFPHLMHRPSSLPLLSDYTRKFLGQELTPVFCAVVDLDCSWMSSCAVKLKIMAVCLAGGEKEMVW